jgi:hypothetical protein
MSRMAGESMVALSMNELTDATNAITVNTVWLRDNALGVRVVVPSVWWVFVEAFTALIVRPATTSQ